MNLEHVLHGWVRLCTSDCHTIGVVQVSVLGALDLRKQVSFKLAFHGWIRSCTSNYHTVGVVQVIVLRALGLREACEFQARSLSIAGSVCVTLTVISWA